MRKEWIFDNKLRNQWDTLEIKDLEWRRGWESNPRIKVLQTSALPLGYRAKTRTDFRLGSSSLAKGGAGDGARTRDIDLGKVALYQLSYSRLQPL